jgi:hypothetical protein
MNWRLKSRIQNGVALLPASTSHAAYYWIQRHFGGLQRVNPLRGLRAGVEILERVARAGRSAAGSTFLEVGTGRRINVPVALWLAGSRAVTTVDLHRYLREELIREDLEYIRTGREEVCRLFDGRIHENRLDRLLDFTNGRWRLADLLDFCGFEYLAPADASILPLQSRSIDCQISCEVFEHIPPSSLKTIIREGQRVLKDGGLGIHRIDYSDHFSHSDPSISPINFLQFTDREWDRLAGNRYMYMNRLRVDDFHRLFEEAGLTILASEPDEDPTLLECVRSGDVTLNEAFTGKPDKVLCTTGSWIVVEQPLRLHDRIGGAIGPESV